MSKRISVSGQVNLASSCYISVEAYAQEYDRDSWSCNLHVASNSTAEITLNEDQARMLINILSSALPRETE